MKNPVVAMALALSGVCAGSAAAGELPPAGSKPLSEIVKAVEGKKLGVIAQAEFDDGRWEVTVCEASACQKLYLDPAAGTEQRRRKTDSDELPPADAKPLSAIVQAVEARGAGSISEVEFDMGHWEFALRKDGRKSKLVVDPRTGQAKP